MRLIVKNRLEKSARRRENAHLVVTTNKEKKVYMEKTEFIKRTGFEPMEEEYKKIERLYYGFDGDKDAFCKHFVASGGVQNFLCKRADTILALEDELRKVVENREKQAKSLEAEIEKLKEELDKELEWRPCSGGTNMPQIRYEELLHTSGVELLSESEAKQLIYEEFGFAPEKVTIISSVSTYEANRHGHMREEKTYERVPLYYASDWNYIRFDCARWMYEMVDGGLHSYNC